MNNIVDILNAHWSEVIDSVITELSLTKISGDIWLKPLRIHDVEDNTIIITTDNEQYDYNYVSKKYGIHIKSAVSEILNDNYEILFLSSSELKDSKPSEKEEAPAEKNLYSINLNPNYTFDNFIKGEPNKLARAAAIEIAKNPGKTIFNPLFLFGGSGVGKTHLAYAIGNEVCRLNPDARVLYVAANTFKLQFQDAVNRNQVPDFLMFYQSVDVLIVDDIQYFSDLKGTQDTFFQIFNYLQQSHKQLILTSDRSPMELRGIQDRLLSRFKWGLAAEITRPDYPLRRDILQYHVKRDGIKLSDDIIEYVASNVSDNVRDLEGVLASLLAYSTLTDSPIDMALTEKVVSRLVQLHPKTYLPADITAAVCQCLHIPENVITARTRQREAVKARNLVMFLIKKYTESSLAEIGKCVHRDHATVAHSLNMVEAQLSYDAVLRQELATIERYLGR